MPEERSTPPVDPDAVPRAVTAARPAHPPGPGRDPRLDTDELRLLIDQAHADVRRTESVGPALALGALLACLPLLLVLVGLLVW